MNNYFTEITWKIDVALFLFSLLLSVMILINMAIRNYIENQRGSKLLLIKKNLFELFLSGQQISESVRLPLLKDVESSIFLDIATNRKRELAFFNKSEQEILKKYFISDKDNIARLGKTANQSRDKWARIEAILSIGYCQIDSLLDALKKSLWDKDEDISYFSMIALEQIKTIDSAKILLDFLKQKTFFRHKIVSLLGQFPKEISTEVAGLIKDQSPSMRLWGLQILTELRPQDLAKDVEELIRDESVEVRSAACECLGALGDKNAILALQKCLKDDAWLVRASVVKALEQILGAQSIPAILPLIKDNSWTVLDSAKNAIAKHIEDALPYIETIFNERDEFSKKTCIEIIEASGYITHLYRNLLSTNPDQKRHATLILDGILKSSPGYGLQAALDDLKSDERKAVLNAIQSINKEWVDTIGAKLKE